MDTKARPAYMLLTRDPLQAKGYIQPENEGMENDVWCKWKFLKSQSSNTHIDKIEFKIKTVRRDKKGHYIMINGSIQEENTVTINISSVQFSLSVVSNSLEPHESQHARPPCPSPTPRVHSVSHPPSQWCHPAISSSVVPFSSCLQFLPASESFPMSQLFAWVGPA